MVVWRNIVRVKSGKDPMELIALYKEIGKVAPGPETTVTRYYTPLFGGAVPGVSFEVEFTNMAELEGWWNGYIATPEQQGITAKIMDLVDGITRELWQLDEDSP